MRLLTKLIALSFIALCLLPSCDKYEDGPGISLRSRKARMANNWKIDRAYDNGDEVTDSYDNYELDLGKSGSARLSESSNFGGVTFTVETSGSWRFINRDQDLELNFENDDADNVYTILRLEENSLWVRERGDDFELHLIPR